MPAPVPDAERAAILDDIRAGQLSCKAIARKYGRSASTVSGIAKDAGLVDAFGRSQTKEATRAREADSKARRAEIAARLLDEATGFLDMLHGPFRVFSFGGKENTYNEQLLPGPPTGDIRNLMTSAAIALDKHVVLEKHDTDDGIDAARSMLGDVAAAIGDAYAQVKAAEAAGEEAGP